MEFQDIYVTTESKDANLTCGFGPGEVDPTKLSSKLRHELTEPSHQVMLFTVASIIFGTGYMPVD